MAKNKPLNAKAKVSLAAVLSIFIAYILFIIMMGSGGHLK